jgi:hypothetical protein
MKASTLGPVLTAIALAVSGCGKGPGDAPADEAVDIGLITGMDARLAIRGLNNPSHVTFRPGDNALTVCDSGNGRVLVLERGVGHATRFLTGFDTEHWKVDTEKNERRYKLGPLCALWISSELLAVSDSGHPDGKDSIAFFDKPGTIADAIGRTNVIAPTSQDPKDLGEGNFVGFALSADGRTIYVCSHGADAKTWILACDIEARKLEPFLSADDHGIAVNSPMQARLRGSDRLLVLYSGAAGAAGGLLVEWDLSEKKPVAKWNLPGLVDPMGMDWIPGSMAELAVVDANWSLTKVNDGKLARVRLPDGGGDAEVVVLASRLKGPISCEFGPDGRLYVAQLGETFDQDKGSVISIGGIR